MSESQSLVIRKFAKDDGQPRVAGFDPITGAKTFIDPNTFKPSPKALEGVRIINDDGVPRVTGLATHYVANAVVEGWMELVNPEPHHYPGGPAGDPWRVTHSFMHADAIVIKTLDGDVRYRVTRQPGKYDAAGNPGQAGDPNTDVYSDYRLELVEG